MTTSTLRPFIFSSLIPLVVFGAESPKALPVVLEMKVPSCPPLARIAGISGTAKFLVQTDGHQIKEFLKSEGPPILQRQLPAQLLSWRFTDHTPMEFTITFKVTVVHQNPCDPKLPDEVKMVLPTLVEITAYTAGECDPVITREPKK